MGTVPNASPVTLDGVSLNLAQLSAIAGSRRSISVAEGAIGALDEMRDRLTTARQKGAVYGANTGVGANRSVRIPHSGDGVNESAAHAKRLLRSHCAGVGPVEDSITTTAAMVVRLNQLLAGGSGVSSTLAAALAQAIETKSVPTLHWLGAIGTGDLSALAELALTLIGERPWAAGGIRAVPLADSDALPFMSSSAVTLATAGLAAADLQLLLESGAVVAALSFLALKGSAQAYDPAVQRARGHPYQAQVATTLRRLVGPASATARVQDPFGLRVVPQVHAPAVGALVRLAKVLETEMNSASENPLVREDGVLHHGQFHLATLASALDHARTSIYPTLTLSAARLGLLHRPDMTGLRPFLAAEAPGSSGLMVTEYIVQDVLAGLRAAVAPASGPSVSISLGMEEHASFATQGARSLREVAASAPLIFASEAVAAVRALRQAPERLRDAPAQHAYEFLARELDPEMGDRPLGEDLERMLGLLPGLSRFVGDCL